MYFLRSNGKNVDKLAVCTKTSTDHYDTPCLGVPEKRRLGTTKQVRPGHRVLHGRRPGHGATLRELCLRRKGAVRGYRGALDQRGQEAEGVTPGVGAILVTPLNRFGTRNLPRHPAEPIAGTGQPGESRLDLGFGHGDGGRRPCISLDGHVRSVVEDLSLSKTIASQ